jgi:hypothetical protein
VAARLWDTGELRWGSDRTCSNICSIVSLSTDTAQAEKQTDGPT